MQKKLLIVDDEKIILNSLQFELQQDGYDVTIASSGEEGLAYIKENFYDLLLTDLVMEGMSGLELLQAAKEIDPDLSVVILTGYGEVSSAIEALRLGADDYLLKPCDFRELLLRISSCLEQQELTKKIKIYESILPICDECQRVRDDEELQNGTKGEWLEMDRFISKKTGLGISHGYCPECFQKTMEEIEQVKKGMK